MLRRHWTFLLALLPLLGWWTYGLFDLDEGFYAAIAQEMNRRGEWVVTYFNGKPWFEKPILTYWLLKPALMLFGDTVGPRVPSILANVALYALCAWFAKRRLTGSAARWVPLVLGTSLLVVGTGRMILTDPLLDLCLTGAFLTFWESLVGDRRWRVAAAACLGAGALAKGPVVGLLFLPVAGWTYWKSPNLRPAFKGWWLAGIAAFVLVVLSWYGPAYLASGQTFVQKFLVEQNWGRFIGGDAAHNVPFLKGGFAFYAIVLLIGFAPWWWRLPQAWKADDDLSHYLKAWALVVFLFFTVSSAKLIHYVLPAVPPLALLVARSLPAEGPRLKPSLIRVAIAFAIANLGFLAYYNGFDFGTLRLFGKDVPLRSAGFHAEVHRIARYVHDHAAPTDAVVLYALPRVTSEKGRARLARFPKEDRIRVDETSHPSVLLYLDRTALEVKDGRWSEILALRQPAWIITRWNRVGPEEIAAAGPRLREIEVPPHDLYRLYKLEPMR